MSCCHGPSPCRLGIQPSSSDILLAASRVPWATVSPGAGQGVLRVLRQAWTWWHQPRAPWHRAGPTVEPQPGTSQLPCLRSSVPGQEEVFYLLLLFLAGSCPAALTSPGQEQPECQQQRESYTGLFPGVCSFPKPSSPQNHSCRDSHPTCTHGCFRSCAGAEAPRAGDFPQPPPCPGLAPARSHGTAWHWLIIKAKSFAGRETQTGSSFHPETAAAKDRAGCWCPTSSCSV